MSFGGVPVMLAGGALDDCREWRCVGVMLGRSWSERDCERTRPQNVTPSRDRMTSSSSPTRWHHRRRSRSTLFHRIGTFCAILAPKVCCRSGGWDRKKGRYVEHKRVKLSVSRATRRLRLRARRPSSPPLPPPLNSEPCGLFSNRAQGRGVTVSGSGFRAVQRGLIGLEPAARAVRSSRAPWSA